MKLSPLYLLERAFTKLQFMKKMVKKRLY